MDPGASNNWQKEWHYISHLPQGRQPLRGLKPGQRVIMGTCPRGHTPIVATEETDTEIIGHCECSTTWYFGFSKKGKAPQVVEGCPTCPDCQEKIEQDAVCLGDAVGVGKCPMCEKRFRWTQLPTKRIDKFGGGDSSFTMEEET